MTVAKEAEAIEVQVLVTIVYEHLAEQECFIGEVFLATR